MEETESWNVIESWHENGLGNDGGNVNGLENDDANVNGEGSAG